jgi:uncharacterized Zn-finger protein
MSSNRLFNNPRFNRVVMAVLLVWIANAAIGIYLLTRFDTLIHSQLYNFGLEFDHAWADTYYFYMQSMYIALFVPVVLSVLSIAAGFKRQTNKTREAAAKLEPRLAQPQPRSVVCGERKAKVKESDRRFFSCPNCKKTFSRPLVMLHFEFGKNRLVNVCPYCSHVLESAENKQMYKSDFQIADVDKKLEQQDR